MTAVTRKDLFHIPEGMVYLDGNSLGPMPVDLPSAMQDMLCDEWGQQLIKGWNGSGWMDQPARVGRQVSRLIGAPDGTVVMGDTLSIKVYQAVASALRLVPERRIILSDTGNFPTDLYMVEGLIKTLDRGYELVTVPPEDVAAAISDEVAVVMLTQVDFCTGRMHDMNEITATAHDAGAVMVWDLAHSAGAVPLDIAASRAEFAVGCTYKYLNGGPGAPAFIYVRPDLVETVEPALSGWLGHRVPFDFLASYQPGNGIERMRVGTPPVLQMTALEVAMKVWDGVDIQDVRAACTELQEQFIAQVEARVPALELISPRTPENRGSQISFRFSHAYEAMQALIRLNVVGDFRMPDVMRFGFTPLFLDAEDVNIAVDRIVRVMDEKLWDDPAFKVRNRVT